PHYVRCPVLVHEFPQGTLGISYQGRLLARYGRDGHLLNTPAPPRRLSAGPTRAQSGTTRPLSRRAITAPAASGRVGSTPAGRGTGRRGQSAQRDGRAAGRATRR